MITDIESLWYQNQFSYTASVSAKQEEEKKSFRSFKYFLLLALNSGASKLLKGHAVGNGSFNNCHSFYPGL